MYNLQLIYSIQPAKCYHNIGSAAFCKACFSSDSGYPSKSCETEVRLGKEVNPTKQLIFSKTIVLRLQSNIFSKDG